MKINNLSQHYTNTHLQQANRNESLIEAFQWAKIAFRRKEKRWKVDIIQLQFVHTAESLECKRLNKPSTFQPCISENYAKFTVKHLPAVQKLIQHAATV